MTSSTTVRRSLETRRGSYVDSVTLMQVSKRVGGLEWAWRSFSRRSACATLLR